MLPYRISLSTITLQNVSALSGAMCLSSWFQSQTTFEQYKQWLSFQHESDLGMKNIPFGAANDISFIVNLCDAKSILFSAVVYGCVDSEMPRYDIESKFRCSMGRVIQRMRAELLRLSNTSTCEDAVYNDDKVCVCKVMSQMITQQLTANCDKNNSCRYIMEYPKYGDCLDQVGVPFSLNIAFKCVWLGVCKQYSW